jgi:hypothetical protein
MHLMKFRPRFLFDAWALLSDFLVISARSLPSHLDASVSEAHIFNGLLLIYESVLCPASNPTDTSTNVCANVCLDFSFFFFVV